LARQIVFVNTIVSTFTSFLLSLLHEPLTPAAPELDMKLQNQLHPGINQIVQTADEAG
jgi:hypothetical protein